MTRDEAIKQLADIIARGGLSSPEFVEGLIKLILQGERVKFAFDALDKEDNM